MSKRRAKATVPVNYRIRPIIANAVDDESEKTGKTKTDIVETALIKHLKIKMPKNKAGVA